MALTALIGVLSFVVAVAGAFVHHWARPVGFVLAVGATAGVCAFARYAARTRIGLAVVGLLWVLPVLVLAQPRPEGDVVIANDGPGLMFLFGGVVAAAVTVGMGPRDVARRPVRAMNDEQPGALE